MTSPAERLPVRSALLLLLVAGMLVLSGCRSDRVQVNTKDPRSPQFAYRLDELALLQMAADDIMELERKKHYGEIYDTYAGNEFKGIVSRRRFLIMSNCVETYLGELQEYDQNQIGFRRESLKEQPGKPFDVLNRRVTRARGTIDEQMVFTASGVNFKLNSLYWIAKDKQFLECIRNSPQVEASTQPVPEQPAETPSGEQPAKPGEPATQPGSPTPATDDQSNKPADGQAPTDGAQQPPVPGSEPAPVQQLKPSEVKQKTIQARPAGAGAVEDTRPTAKPVKKKPAQAPAKKPDDTVPATPLEPVAPVPEMLPAEPPRGDAPPSD